jgi:hypothetical protein
VPSVACGSETLRSSILCIAAIFAPIANVFAAIAAVFQPVATIFAAVADIFQSIAQTAMMPRIADIFATIPTVFAAIADVLPAIAAILAAIADVFQPITNLSSMTLGSLSCDWHQQRRGQNDADRVHHVRHVAYLRRRLILRPTRGPEV